MENREFTKISTGRVCPRCRRVLYGKTECPCGLKPQPKIKHLTWIKRLSTRLKQIKQILLRQRLMRKSRVEDANNPALRACY